MTNTREFTRNERRGLIPEWTPDWIYHEQDDKAGYLIDMVLKPHGSIEDSKRIASAPMLPKEEMEDEDAHIFLVAAGLEALGRGLMQQVPEEKRQRWEASEGQVDV